MKWRFWRRERARKGDAGPVAQEKEQDFGTQPPLQFSTVKEVLALQQLIGNQAVLRMIAPSRSGAAKPELNERTGRR